MKVFFSLEEVHIDSPTAVAIGKFDGDHIGHRKIFSSLAGMKQKQGYQILLFSLMEAGRLLQDQEERIAELERIGIDYLVLCPFDERIRSIGAEEFVRDILVGKFRMKYIAAGSDCSFGAGKTGNADLLLRMSRELDYSADIIEKIKDDSGDISSTRIRELILSGDVSSASELLGKYYSVSGVVVHGNHIGSELLGIPTVNIFPEDSKIIPANGVYLTGIRIDDTGESYYGVTNVGGNPSIDRDQYGHRIRIETHILDYDGELYGKRITCSFLRKIREERRFSDFTLLKKQIENDRKTAQILLTNM